METLHCDNTKNHLELGFTSAPNVFFMHNWKAQPKGLLNKSSMSVDTLPGGKTHYHHHAGTGPHSSNSSVLKDGDVLTHILRFPSALALPKRGASVCSPKERWDFFCTPWIDIKEPTKSRLAERQRWAVITAKRGKERDEPEAKA